ncbi:MAG: hypothetical protein WBO46_22540 [Caldilineaceae bacterium]
MSVATVVIVAGNDDLLATNFKDRLIALGDRVLAIHPGALSSLAVCLENEKFQVAGQSVSGILFRTPPDATFSDSFQAGDRRFCDVEARALWLAALQLDSVFTINRYDASVWFEGLHWPAWRRCLLAGGIPVSSFAFGGNVSSGWWYPYRSKRAQPLPGSTTRRLLGTAVSDCSSVQSSLAVSGKIVTGEKLSSVLATVESLTGLGIGLSEIFTDAKERVLAIDTQPLIGDRSLAELTSNHLATTYYEHLHRR